MIRSGRVHVFADEAGNFDFSRGRGASRYFILTTITITDCTVGSELLDLRRQLAWEGQDFTQEFHATEERQIVRDEVFKLLARHSFRIDATIFDKPKTQSHLQEPAKFYKLAWYYHYRHLGSAVVGQDGELFVIAAALGTKLQRATLHQAVVDVISNTSERTAFRTQFWPAASDPCLQVADYCCWAIQRKWERADSRSYSLIADKIASEYPMFSNAEKVYY